MPQGTRRNASLAAAGSNQYPKTHCLKFVLGEKAIWHRPSSDLLPLLGAHIIVDVKESADELGAHGSRERAIAFLVNDNLVPTR